jgi:hypothetical protein
VEDENGIPLAGSYSILNRRMKYFSHSLNVYIAKNVRITYS